MKKTGPVRKIVYSKMTGILLLFFLSAFIVLSLWFHRKLNQSQKQRYLSYIAADELRQSSDDLTRMVRTYVVTKDPRYEQMYWDILAIRNGQKPRPVRYENIYWDFMAFTNEKPRPDGQKISLLEIMKGLKFTQEELAKLKEAETHSNDLVKTEMIAMHAMKGEFLNAEGESIPGGEPDYDYARTLLYDESYHSEKVDIMTPIDEFFVLVNARTEAQVTRDTIYTYIFIFLVYVTITLLLWLARVELNERKIAQIQIARQAEKLVQTNQLLDQKVIARTEALEKAKQSAETAKRADQAQEKLMVTVKAQNQQLNASNQQLIASEQQLRANEEELKQAVHNMGERIKELNCLNGLSLLIEQHDITLEEIFQGLMELIPPGWHYPDITAARIIFNDREFKTDNFKKTKWEQSADIKVSGRKAGVVEVYYLKECPILDEGPFLKEERNLIDGICRALGQAIQRKQAEETLQAANQQLVASEQQLKASNQQLNASNQQLIASEQQLRASNQHTNALNQQLEASQQELSLKNEELQSIVYISSHDLKTPLVNITGFSEMLIEHCGEMKELLEKCDADADTKKEITSLLNDGIPADLDYISTSTERMKRLIEGLLQVSRIGTIEIETQNIDMEDIVAEIIDNVKYKTEELDAKIAFENLPDCTGDKDQITQVFTNLIDNALKYLSPDRKGIISITGKTKNKESIYCIEDNGIGINPAYYGKVFEIYHRLNPQTSTKGDGLGLTIVRRILDRHKGRIWLESEPEKGSKFFIAIPTK